MAVTEREYGELIGEVRYLVKRLNGHIPEDCITHANQIKAVTESLDEIKANSLWLKRAVIAALVVAIINLVLPVLTKHI